MQFKGSYKSFEEARQSVRYLALKNQKEGVKYCTSGKKLIDIQSSPNIIYKSEWKGWGDFLGTSYVASYKRMYRSFEDAIK